MQRKSFVFYESWWEAIKNLPRDVQGDVLTAIVEYGLSGVTTGQLKPITKAMLAIVKPQIDANNQRFENGKQGGRPKAESNQNETKEKPTKNQNETEAEPTNVICKNENVNEKKIYPYRDIVDRWNAVCGSAGMAKVLSLTEKRKKKIRTRLEEMEKDPSKWLETIEKIFRRAAASDFLRGAGGGWKASFDWVFENSENWLKIMEGRYDNNNQKKSMGGYDGTGSRQGARRTDVPPAASVPAGRGESIF